MGVGGGIPPRQTIATESTISPLESDITATAALIILITDCHIRLLTYEPALAITWWQWRTANIDACLEKIPRVNVNVSLSLRMCVGVCVWVSLSCACRNWVCVVLFYNKSTRKLAQGTLRIFRDGKLELILICQLTSKRINVLCILIWNDMVKHCRYYRRNCVEQTFRKNEKFVSTGDSNNSSLETKPKLIESNHPNRTMAPGSWKSDFLSQPQY